MSHLHKAAHHLHKHQSWFAVGLFLSMLFFVAVGVGYTLVNLRHKNQEAFNTRLKIELTPTTTPVPPSVLRQQFLDQASAVVDLYQGNYDELSKTLVQLEQFVALYPTNARAKAILAQGYLDLIDDIAEENKKQEVISNVVALVDQALKLDPKDLDAFHVRFNYYNYIRELENAQSTYELMKQYYPDDLSVKNIEGRLANWRGNYQEAIEIGQYVLNQNPEKHDFYMALIVKGYAYEHLNDLENWEQNFEQVVVLYHGPWDYQSFAIGLGEKKQDYAKARLMMREGLNHFDFIAGRITLQEMCTKHGTQLYKQGKYQEAFAAFEEGIDAYPADCHCGYLETISGYYTQYAQKTGDGSLRQRAREILDLKGNPQI